MPRNQGRSARLAVISILVAAVLFAPRESDAQRGVSPYLPLDIAPEIEADIERIMILAEKPVLTRPIAAAAVLDALDAACEKAPRACTEVRRYLQGFMKPYGLVHASIDLATTDDAAPLPNRHGMSSNSRYEAAAQIFWQPADKLLIAGGGVAASAATTPTGSMISVGNEYLQVDAGFRDHWFSPMTDSAMLISTQAETMPSITASNYTPLTRFNLHYELFLAEMSESSNIALGGGLTAGNPRLFGMHVSITPFPGWSFGLNRVMQYGGGERSDSFGDLIDAFFRPSEFDNTGSTDDPLQEFGNQAAALTARYVHSGERPFSVYFEYAGEDTSTNSNVRLGNVGMSVGLHLPVLLPRFDLTLELGEWQNGWYTSHIYRDGLRHEGNVIGHWGADWRVTGDGVGAQSIMARAEWHMDTGARLEASYRALANEDYTAPVYERAELLGLRYSHPFGETFAGAALELGRDSFGVDFSRLSVFLRY